MLPERADVGARLYGSNIYSINCVDERNVLTIADAAFRVEARNGIERACTTFVILAARSPVRRGCGKRGCRGRPRRASIPADAGYIDFRSVSARARLAPPFRHTALFDPIPIPVAAEPNPTLAEWAMALLSLLIPGIGCLRLRFPAGRTK